MLAVFLGIWEHPEVLGGQTEVWVVPTLLFLSATRDHVWRGIHPDQPVWSSCRCSDPQVGLNFLLVNRALLWCLKFLSYSVPGDVSVHSYLLQCWSMSLDVTSFIMHCPSCMRTEVEWTYLRSFWTKNVAFMSKDESFNPERAYYLWISIIFIRNETKDSLGAPMTSWGLITLMPSRDFWKKSLCAHLLILYLDVQLLGPGLWEKIPRVTSEKC